ncbi:hypothetical protein UFOVP653_56 [uncultured Caudovirales phage]|uniref:Uncharacterized protein n=1 Tax=uncultured Caudovirales phage TaxID=2100421 RepID=A0A6J5NC02_9CAUD|nr:hypothetical protein UFOVP653_56 [uncultured Caudovirales phage]
MLAAYVEQGYWADGYTVGPIVDPIPVQPQGGVGHVSKTSRYSDPHAYDADRVAERLAKVVIDGVAYDPFDATLFDRLQEAAKRPVQATTELERHERKLARTFEIVAGEHTLQVPMFRPMLREMPDFQRAEIAEFYQYSERARQAAAEEQRRIRLLLMMEYSN